MMEKTGKVFTGSTDVYQDQATILYDFYLNAARKIVEQEDRYDQKCADLQKETEGIEYKRRNVKRDYIIWGVVALVGLVLVFAVHWLLVVLILLAGGMMLKTFFFNKNVQQELVKKQQEIEVAKREKGEIFRDYRVDKIGVVYVPVAKRVSYGERSVVVDLTGSTPMTDVSLQIVNNPSALVGTLRDLQMLSTEAPIVENAEQVEEVETSDYSASIQDVKFYDYFGKMDRTLRTGAYYLSDVSAKQISVPFVLPSSQRMAYLDLYAATTVVDKPVVPVFDENRYTREMEEFEKINQFHAQFEKENADFEEVLRHLIANIGVAVQTVATLKVASNNKLIDNSNKLLFTILKNSYNHYSPLLEHEEIEKIRNTNFNYSDTVENYTPFQLKQSSRVKYDAQTGNWVAEDGTSTTMPFGISQIQEEIVAPIVQNLLAETRIERLKVYNDIKNQKINYLNQWHQDTEDFYGRNRTSSDDLLNIMRSNMTKFIASQATLESVSEIKSNMRRQMIAGERSDDMELESTLNNSNRDEQAVAAFEVQSQQFRQAQEDFDDYMERLKDDIDERARNFEFIEYYDASLRDRLAKDLVSAADTQDQLDERRRPLASVNPLYAQASVLPPSPSVDESVNEQLSLNVARFAANTLQDMGERMSVTTSAPPVMPEAAPIPEVDPMPEAEEEMPAPPVMEAEGPMPFYDEEEEEDVNDEEEVVEEEALEEELDEDEEVMPPPPPPIPNNDNKN